jgi:hypothetical protein
MKRVRWFFSLILLAAAAAEASAQKAQLTVADDNERSELVFTVGPVDLPCGEDAVIKQPPVQGVVVPISAYFRGFTVDLVDAHGRVVPSVVLHHVNIIAPQRRELFSPIMQRVGAAGAETGPLYLPRLLGYPVQRGDSVVIAAMLHNPTSEEYHGVQLRVRMKYSRIASLMPKLAIQPFYLDVMPPAGLHVFTLPAGKSTRSWEGSPAVPGRVMALGGHMHKYGTRLRFEDVTKGKVLWEATPVIDSTGAIVAMPRKFYKFGIHLDPKHVYRLTAEYDNPTGEPIEEGAMGTLGGAFIPDDRATWPNVDRENPEYKKDVLTAYARNSAPSVPQQHHH